MMLVLGLAVPLRENLTGASISPRRCWRIDWNSFLQSVEVDYNSKYITDIGLTERSDMRARSDKEHPCVECTLNIFSRMMEHVVCGVASESTNMMQFCWLSNGTVEDCCTVEFWVCYSRNRILYSCFVLSHIAVSSLWESCFNSSCS